MKYRTREAATDMFNHWAKELSEANRDVNYWSEQLAEAKNNLRGARADQRKARANAERACRAVDLFPL